MGDERYRNINMRDSLNLNFFVLKIAGLWPPEEKGDGKETKTKRRNYRIYALFLIFTTYVVYVTTEVMNMYFALGDLEKMTNASFLLMTHTIQIIKYYNVQKYRPKIVNLADGLNRDIFRPRNQKQYQIFKCLTKQFERYYQIFLVSCFFCVLLWGVFPFVDSRIEARTLPMSAWYPFETKSFPRFELLFAYQMVAVCANGFFIISIDAMGPGFMTHICVQLDLLSDSLENIHEYTMEDAKNTPAIPNEENTIHKHLRKSLNRIILHHQTILEYLEYFWVFVDLCKYQFCYRFKKDVNDVFASIIFWQFVLSVVVICITMFKLTIVPVLSIEFLSMALYQICLMCEILFYCWYGNEMILKSSRLILSAWNSDWTGCTQDYKKDLVFFMLRCQKTLQMYGGNFFTLSLETFIAILRSSWSYFAVLYNVHNST